MIQRLLLGLKFYETAKWHRPPLRYPLHGWHSSPWDHSPGELWLASSPEKPRQTVPTSTGNWQCLGEHTAHVEFFTFFSANVDLDLEVSWGFLRYLEIPEEERTHIWFNQKQVQKTKHHCSGTVVADTSWPSPATASARAKGLFESANVLYLNMTMENHMFFKGKASISRLFSIARVSSPDLSSLSFQETAGLELPHPLSWKQNHVIHLYSHYFSYILVISLIHLIYIYIYYLFIDLFIYLFYLFIYYYCCVHYIIYI